MHRQNADYNEREKILSNWGEVELTDGALSIHSEHSHPEHSHSELSDGNMCIHSELSSHPLNTPTLALQPFLFTDNAFCDRASCLQCQQCSIRNFPF